MKKNFLILSVALLTVFIYSHAIAGGPKKISKCMTISKSGSYVVNKNLQATTKTNGNCITIEADNVTLDLNGFTLTGLDGFISAGVHVPPDTFRGVTIRNGFIRGFTHGVVLSGNIDNGCIVEKVTAFDNEFMGIVSGRGNTIKDNLAFNNGGHGFYISEGSTATGNTSRGNGISGSGRGMMFDCPCNVIGNTATNNQNGNYDYNGTGCLWINNLFP